MRSAEHGYPIGSPGVGLLTLRCAVAAHAFSSGMALASTGAAEPMSSNWTATAWATACLVGAGLATLGLASGPAFATVGMLNVVAVALTLVGATVTLPEPPTSLALWAVASLGLMLVGPGWYSLDAIRFGRRQIEIASHVAEASGSTAPSRTGRPKRRKQRRP